MISTPGMQARPFSEPGMAPGAAGATQSTSPKRWERGSAQDDALPADILYGCVDWFDYAGHVPPLRIPGNDT